MSIIITIEDIDKADPSGKILSDPSLEGITGSNSDYTTTITMPIYTKHVVDSDGNGETFFSEKNIEVLSESTIGKSKLEQYEILRDHMKEIADIIYGEKIKQLSDLEIIEK